MKPIAESEDLLVLDHTPWLLGAFFAVLALASLAAGLVLLGSDQPLYGPVFLAGALVPALLLVVFGARVQVVFDRAKGAVEFRRLSVLGRASESLPLDMIERAELRESISVKSGSANETRYRPVLHLRGGDIRPLVKAYANFRSDAPAVEAINRWLGVQSG